MNRMVKRRNKAPTRTTGERYLEMKAVSTNKEYKA